MSAAVSLGMVVRKMDASECAMCLSNWKKELWETRNRRGWSRMIQERDFWCLVNHALDRITLPSCEVFVGCHESDVETPICWVAVRRIVGLSTYEVVYLYARKSLREEPELAAGLERELLSKLDRPIAVERRPYNAFLELRR